MRGMVQLIGVCGLLFCGICTAQKVQFNQVDEPLVLEHMKNIPESNAARVAKLKELFTVAGCHGDSLFEQKVDGAETPNVVCVLGTGEDDPVIVGAHYERASSTQSSS